MKKKTFLLAALAALLSCSKSEQDTLPTKSFTLHFKGDFTHSFEDMTRASVRLEEDNTAAITDVWVLDYQDGLLKQTIHQSSEDTDFGHPSLNLTYGTHELKLIASKGEDPSRTSTSLSWSKVKDTFTLNYPVTVAASTNGNRAPELKRSVGGVKLAMTDAVPNNAVEIHITINRSNTLLLPSLTPSTTESWSNILTFPSSWKGKTGGSITTYTLCPSDEYTTEVSILVLDGNGNPLSQFQIPDVPIKQNRITTLTGEVFNRSNAFSISIDDTWDEDLNLTF